MGERFSELSVCLISAIRSSIDASISMSGLSSFSFPFCCLSSLLPSHYFLYLGAIHFNLCSSVSGLLFPLLLTAGRDGCTDNLAVAILRLPGQIIEANLRILGKLISQSRERLSPRLSPKVGEWLSSSLPIIVRWVMGIILWFSICHLGKNISKGSQTNKYMYSAEMKISLVFCSGYQYLTHNKQCYQVPSSFLFQVPRIAGLEVNDSFMIVFVILHVLNALL